MFARTSAALLLALGVLAACSDDENGATDAGKDSGLVWTPDAGGGDPADSGADAGLVRACAKPREAFPAAALPRCTAETGACVAACESAANAGACRDACVAKDKHAPLAARGAAIGCQSCISLQLFACADQGDCHDPVAGLFCCLADKCPAGSADGCSGAMCGTEIDSALTCIVNVEPQCADYTSGFIGDCFEGFTVDDEDAGTDAGQ